MQFSILLCRMQPSTSRMMRCMLLLIVHQRRRHQHLHNQLHLQRRRHLSLLQVHLRQRLSLPSHQQPPSSGDIDQLRRRPMTTWSRTDRSESVRSSGRRRESTTPSRRCMSDDWISRRAMRTKPRRRRGLLPMSDRESTRALLMFVRISLHPPAYNQYVNQQQCLVRLQTLKPRLHQDTCCSATCVPDEQLVSGYIYVDGHMMPDTSCSFGIHVDCISAT